MKHLETKARMVYSALPSARAEVIDDFMSSPNTAPRRSLDPEALARLRELSRDVDPGLFNEILTAFRDDLGKYLTAMQFAVAGKNAEALERSAHAMKGASMNTGALALGALSARIEEAAANGGLAVASILLAELAAEIQRVQADIALELSAPA
jgi:HPt (histidine-containing phosphotransfer) domain-containing protein